MEGMGPLKSCLGWESRLMKRLADSNGTTAIFFGARQIELFGWLSSFRREVVMNKTMADSFSNGPSVRIRTLLSISMALPNRSFEEDLMLWLLRVWLRSSFCFNRVMRRSSRWKLSITFLLNQEYSFLSSERSWISNRRIGAGVKVILLIVIKFVA